MTNILLAAILLVNVAVLAGIFVVFHIAKRECDTLRNEYEAIRTNFIAFVSPGPDNEPSPLAKATEAIAGQFARAATASVKTTLMGMASGEAREALAAHTEQAQQAGLGGVLNLVPSLKKKRYAGLLDLAMSFLASRGNGHQPDPGATTSYSPKFHL